MSITSSSFHHKKGMNHKMKMAQSI